MKFTLDSIKPKIEKISIAINFTLKLIIGMGCLIILFYFLRIDYFPQDISLGDSMTFIIIALLFGALYTILIICTSSLGVTLSPILRYILYGLAWLTHKIEKTKKPQAKQIRYTYIKFKIASIPYSALGLLLIYALSERKIISYIHFLFLIISLYILQSLILTKKHDIKKYIFSSKPDQIIFHNNHNSEKEKSLASKTKHIYYGTIGFILIIPIILSGISSPLIDGAMRIAQIRIEKPIIYIKTPYSDLLPEKFISTNLKKPTGFIAFQGITVLFRGLGNNTLISFTDHTLQRNIEIPNNQIIIERTKPTKNIP